MKIFPSKETEFVLCGCCEHYHRTNYYGDCRNDDERYTFYELEDHYGQGEWVEIETEIEDND